MAARPEEEEGEEEEGAPICEKVARFKIDETPVDIGLQSGSATLCSVKEPGLSFWGGATTVLLITRRRHCYADEERLA